MQNVSNDLYNDAAAITPSDTADHAWVIDGIHVGGAGNIVVVLEDNATVTLTGCLAGHVYRLRGRRVNATLTTATSLTGMRFR